MASQVIASGGIPEAARLRRGQGCPLRVGAAPAVHHGLLVRCRPLDGNQDTPATPAGGCGPPSEPGGPRGRRQRGRAGRFAAIAVGLARTVIELVGDGIRVGPAGRGEEVRSLGEALPRQPVGVPVGTSLPGRRLTHRLHVLPADARLRMTEIGSGPRTPGVIRFPESVSPTTGPPPVRYGSTRSTRTSPATSPTAPCPSPTPWTR